MPKRSSKQKDTQQLARSVLDAIVPDAEAKARVFENQRGDDVHVGNAGDEDAAAVSRRAPCRTRWFGRLAGDGNIPGDGTWVASDRIVSVRDDERVDLARPTGAGSVALALDAAAATEAALSFGLAAEAVSQGLTAFPELPHRGAIVAEIDGVAFVDDSKATNPHAALASLEDRRDVVLLAGGLAKGVDLAPLRAAAASLRSVVALGEATEELAAVFSDLVPVRRAASIEEAARLAFEDARGGGTVLLAPACASQDMFRDYRERGERFARAARELGEARARSDRPAAAPVVAGEGAEG